MGTVNNGCVTKTIKFKSLFSEIKHAVTDRASAVNEDTRNQIEDSKTEHVIVPLDIELAEKRYDADLKLWKILIPAE